MAQVGMGRPPDQTLEHEVKAFADDPGVDPFLRVRAEHQSKRHAFAIIINGIVPLPEHWGLLMSDIAHNLRSSLDYIAWAIVSRGKRAATHDPRRAHEGDQGSCPERYRVPFR
jgi:hypothetical protein